MNLQKSIKKILREESNLSSFIKRRIPYEDLEKEFDESLEMSSNMLRNTYNERGKFMSLSRFIEITISILMDGIHYDLHSSLPKQYNWYDQVVESLKNHFKNKIKKRYEDITLN